MLANLPPPPLRPTQEFGLTLDIDALIRDADLDKSGFIEYGEFKTMLS